MAPSERTVVNRSRRRDCMGGRWELGIGCWRLGLGIDSRLCLDAYRCHARSLIECARAIVWRARVKVMGVDGAVVSGTLRDDGVLELDEKPQLAPGRVRVTISAMAAPASSQRHQSILEVLDEIHARQVARGYWGSFDRRDGSGAGGGAAGERVGRSA
jgi:hypothetical protein